MKELIAISKQTSTLPSIHWQLAACLSVEIEASSGIQEDLGSVETLDQTPSCFPVLSGGFWKPSGCLPRQRVAIIVPYRDREPHLKIFLQIIHPFLQKQLLQYTVFIVEQVTRFYVINFSLAH